MIDPRSSAGGALRASASAATLTITEEARPPRPDEHELLTLSLSARLSVRWYVSVSFFPLGSSSWLHSCEGSLSCLPQRLTLCLSHRDENVVDNEGLGRKSSKRCCIFHKQRSFGESSTDSSDYDSDRSGSSSGTSVGAGGETKPSRKHKKIARPKKGNKVPDSQRYHA
jgi:hypothetical protein